MLDLDLSALDGLVLTVPEVTKSNTGVKIDRIPVDAHLRVFSTGAIYPSEAFAKDYSLEYAEKVEVVSALNVTTMEEVGNGLDIFQSKYWSMIDLPLELLMIAITPKKEAKVDIWGGCKFNEDGTPKSSVLTQGKATFVKAQLLNMLTETYEVDWAVTDFVELSLVEDKIMTSPTGKYYLPTTVSRGADKGAQSVKTRDSIKVFPLVLTTTSFIEGAISPSDLAMDDKAGDPALPEASVKEVEADPLDTEFSY